MNGKPIVIIILLCAVLAGAGLYYQQVYAYYFEVTPSPGQDVTLVRKGSTEAEPIAYEGFQAIDADSSPIRYRACFTTDLDPQVLDGTYERVQDPTPLVGPRWFDCFDATGLGAALEAGEAQAYLSEKNVHFGVDRVVAILSDGRGYAWHELNDCGEKAYDGTVVGEECPPRE
ncbi:DUF6446 family protein [Primorskyibacter sp. S87]|uniref:DUF6446 family protein n=1 Tax=Primorskyibacter sp. S87 TaxID=3415126 RepID=UPI003C7A6981